MYYACGTWLRICVLDIGMYLLAALSNGVMAARSWKIQASAPGTTFNDDAWMMFLQAAALPLSNESLGSFTWTAWSGPVTQPYSAPADIAPLAFFPLVMAGSLGMLWLFCSALAFAALPISRRRAKVRWRHIIRITCYGVALAGVLELIIGFFILNFFRGPWKPGLEPFITLLFSVSGVVFFFLWWSLAAGRYLRMQHPWGVGLAVVIVGKFLPIGAVSAIYLLSPGPL